MKHTIDAQDKKIGRVASEAASILMGKNSPSFRKNISGESEVLILNASKADVTLKRKKETEYVRYSGYPGGLKIENMSSYMKRHGFAGVIRKAVQGMMPKNKLHKGRMKRLVINE
ncbi:MAG: 50S ribosomal protein L13 [bacterium]|nr:50S ribosomal protein L13 [bacterium]